MVWARVGAVVRSADACARQVLLETVHRLVAEIDARYGARSEAASPWSTRHMILIVVALLGLYLLMTL